MKTHIKTVLFTLAGFISGIICVASGNRFDPSVMAVPFVISGVMAHNSKKAEAGPLSYFGGAMIGELLLFLLDGCFIRLRPFAVCLSPLAAYHCSELFHGGFLKAVVSGMLSVTALTLSSGRAAVVGCGCIAALGLDMVKTALELDRL